MDGNRGAKGSIKDRIISMLYRKRYNNYKMKKAKWYVKTIKKLNVYNLFNNKKKRLYKGVLFKRKYKYISPKVGIGQQIKVVSKLDINQNNSIKDSKEISSNTKRKTDISNYIYNSKLIIKEIKTDITYIKLNKTNKDAELELKYLDLKKKADELVNQYNLIKNISGFSKYAISGGLKIMNSLNDYKSLSSLNQLQSMINICEKEINKISNTNLDNRKRNKNIGIDIINNKDKKMQKNNEITIIKNKKAPDFENETKGIKKLDDIDSIIYCELNKQQSIINDMYKKVDKIESYKDKEIIITGYGKLISSIFKVAVGLVTLPFSNKKLFGIFMGAALINKGIKGLNQGLKVEQKIVIKYNYEDLKNKILSSKDKLGDTLILITDSLNEIDELKNNIKEKFIDIDCKEITKKIDVISKSLNRKKEQLLKMNQDLNKQYEMNKIKIKKIS